MDLKAYLQSIQDKTVAVIGIGVSNTPLIELLLQAGIQVTACDKKQRSEFADLADRLEAKGAVLQLGEDYLEGLTQDIIFRTPGMRPDVPQLLQAKERGSIITSEMEVFFDVCPCFTIAVTGSDGKTTTTTLISELLKKAGKTVYLGGNIGNPLLCQAGEMEKDAVAVLELSSFQLMTMQQSPDIAVITNLAPNHLDVHKDMAEYVDAKKNIYLHQNGEGILVLNRDNELTCSLQPEAKGSLRLFSRQEKVENGVFQRGEEIILCRGGKEELLMTVSDIRIPGVHNVENYMAAIAAVCDLVDREEVQAVARSFGGVAHRIELVREKDGVRYYNDSIASSPSRTMAGLRAFEEKVILIAGGKDKGISYDELGPEIVRYVKALYLTGPTAEKIRAAVENCPDYDAAALPICQMEDFKQTVLAASAAAKPGDVVILSPASTSFDRFKNFVERGNTFKEIISQL